MIARKVRAAVAARAANRCEYCRFPAWGQPAIFGIDHVRPRSRGGITVLTNLALACPRCNGTKADQVRATDSVTRCRVRLFNPRTQNWHDHFQWTSQPPVLLEGKTDVGRATIIALEMNHPEMLLARRLQVLLGNLP